MGALSPLRNRLSGLTRWRKPRLTTCGSPALAGADEGVTRGLFGSAGVGSGATATSCALFRTGSAGNFTTSVYAGGGVTFVGAGFDPCAAVSALATLVGTGLGGLWGGSVLGMAVIRATFVTAGFGAGPFGIACASSFVAVCRADRLTSASSCRTVACSASAFAGAGFNARYSRYFASANSWSFRYRCDTIARFSKAGP